MDRYNTTNSGVKTIQQVVQRTTDLDVAELEPFAESYKMQCELAKDAGQWKQAALYDRAKRHIEGAIKAIRKVPDCYK